MNIMGNNMLDPAVWAGFIIPTKKWVMFNSWKLRYSSVKKIEEFVSHLQEENQGEKKDYYRE